MFSVLIGLVLLATGSVSAADIEDEQVSNTSDSNVMKKFVDGFMVNNQINVEADGDITSGNQVNLLVNSQGEPVANAFVAVNGADAGTTSEDGNIEVKVPDSPVFRVKAEKGDMTGYMRRKVS